MTDQFIRLLPRRKRPALCVFGVALAFAAGGLTAHCLHGDALVLAKKIARAESLRAADLQTEVDKATAALAAEQRKNWELVIRLDAVRQPLADIAELTTAVRKLTLPTLSPRKSKTVPPPKPTVPRAAQPGLRMIPPPKPSPSPAHAKEKSWSEQMTAAHNKVRATVGVPPLTWDDGLAQDAGQWALRLAQTCGMVHSGMAHGENLFRASGGSEPTVEDIVKAWAEERNYYDYASNSCAAGKVCGHYTQLVWKNTEMLGCAVAACADGKGYISACEYEKAGNWAGEKPY